jgi:hypothetical protein
MCPTVLTLESAKVTDLSAVQWRNAPPCTSVQLLGIIRLPLGATNWELQKLGSQKLALSLLQ